MPFIKGRRQIYLLVYTDIIIDMKRQQRLVHLGN